MFIWRADVVLNEIEKQMPPLSNALTAIGTDWGTTRQMDVLNEQWKSLKIVTIDYGVMEKAAKVAVMPAGGLGWSDVGSWESLFEVLLPDMSGNITANNGRCSLTTPTTPSCTARTRIA
jgi:mannose-1-phosphate guanylyltransferase